MPALNPKIAQEICDHALPELMICTHFDWACSLADDNRRLPIVFATTEDPDAELLLQAMRSGLTDVWRLPVEDDFVRERIHRHSRSIP